MSWKSVADLIVDGTAEVALVGAPMEAGSVTPGRCDLAPAAIGRTLRRFSTYDVETGAKLSLRLLDDGDADVVGVMPADASRRSSMRCAAARSITASQCCSAATMR